MEKSPEYSEHHKSITDAETEQGGLYPQHLGIPQNITKMPPGLPNPYSSIGAFATSIYPTQHNSVIGYSGIGFTEYPGMASGGSASGSFPPAHTLVTSPYPDQHHFETQDSLRQANFIINSQNNFIAEVMQTFIRANTLISEYSQENKLRLDEIHKLRVRP